MLQTLEHIEEVECYAQGAARGNPLDVTYARLECAVRGNTAAAIAVLRRLVDGDMYLWMAIDDPLSTTAEQMREALLRYLALGTWQGWTLPLPEDPRFGQEGCALHTLLRSATCESAVRGWHATLLATVRDPDPRLRRITASLLAGCDDPDALMASVKLLGDPDEDVRWAAAFALADHNGATVTAVLRRLTSWALVPALRHTAAYVLRRIPDAALRQQAAPVVAALDSASYREATPLAASDVLRALGACGSCGPH